ncbi:hypothetical protein BDW69DRAFT_188795 [Aspergillus filifer]
MDHYGSEHGALDLNPASYPDPSAVLTADVLPRALLEDDLDTGHITLVEFKPNGQIKRSFRRRACNMKPVHVAYCVQFKPLEEVVEDRVGGNAATNSDLEMSLPVIDILEGAKARGEFLFGFDGDRDGWTEDIKTYAPGYLEMEAAGIEADYGHSRLIDPINAYDIQRCMYEAKLA